MKQKIYILGLITTMVIVLSAMLKMNHLPGAFHLMILGIFSLVCIFIPLALKNHYMTEGNRKNLSLYIVTWLTSFVVFVGMLYKIQHWPYAGIALMIAIPFPYLVFLPVFLTVTSRDKNFSIYNMVSVLFLLSGISIFSVLLSLNVSKERMADSMLLSENFNRIETVLDQTTSPAVQTNISGKIGELLGIIDDYQSLIFTNEGISEEQWNNDPWSLPKPEFPCIATKALSTGGKNPSLDIRLDAGLHSLTGELEKSAGYEALAKAAPSIFDYKEYPGEPNEWTRQMFCESPRVWSLIYLDGLETNLKMIRAGL